LILEKKPYFYMLKSGFTPINHQCMSVKIKEVNSKADLKKFIWFGINLYKDNPFAAPPLMMDDYMNLSKGKNPALEFCETAIFLAYKDDKIVGRIAGIINPVANETWKTTNARFGWVDFIDDKEVSTALFDAVIQWAKSKGMNHLEGPLGFTDMDNEGALIEGYDQLSTLATIYNYPYYIEHYESYGFEKEIDWKEYLITIPKVLPERYIRIAEIVKNKSGLKPLKFTSKKELVSRYAVKIFELLNVSYQHLYGYSKLNRQQIDFYIKLYFSFFRLDTVVVVVDEKDEVVALGISMPSFTKALQKAKGSLFPLGWWHMLQALKKNDILDLYLMCVHPDYQNKGVNSVIFSEMLPVAANSGFKFAESNPELETNLKMSSHWDEFEHINHKRRRLYKKEI
jgi:GNAT superfamily N-acetyltransferase